MNELQTLYQSIIREHQREERWRGPLTTATASAEGDNPKCGDHIKLHAEMANDNFVKLRFEAAGCALLNASASLMCAELEGKPKAMLADKTATVQALLSNSSTVDLSELGQLSALAGAAPYPSRHRCVLLPWETLSKLAAES